MSDSLNSSSLFASTSELAGSNNMDKSFSKSKKKSNIKEAIIADVEQEKKELKTGKKLILFLFFFDTEIYNIILFFY